MIRQKVIFRNNGFSLVEAMVGLSITCIAMYGLLTVLQNHQKATLTAKRNLEFQNISDLLSLYLASSDTCVKLFKNTKINFPIQAINESKPLTGTDFISVNNLDFEGSNIATVGVEKNGLKPTNIGLSKVYKAYTNHVNNFFVFDFVFAADKVGDTYGGSNRFKSFQAYYKTTLDGQIISCGQIDSSDEGRCVFVGKVFDYATFPFCK